MTGRNSEETKGITLLGNQGTEYADDYADDYDEILCYGIAFLKKRCVVKKK